MFRGHPARWLVHDRLQTHAIENIAIKIHPRRDFLERNSLRGQPKDRALGHVDNLLAAAPCIFPAEGDLIDLVHELAHLPMALDRQPPVAAN